MTELGKVRGRLLLVANLAAATTAAGFWVAAFVRPSTFGALPPDLAATAARELRLPLGTGIAWAAFLLALLLLVCNFAWLVRRPPAAVPRTYVQSETPTGTVRVAREALEAGLKQAGESLPEITRLRVQVDTSQPKRIGVQGFFQCAEGTSNLNASQRLRAALRERFAEMVHLGDGARVDFELEFQGFLGKLGKKALDARASLEPEPPPFTGPQYPIEDDEGGAR
jgi:hypothetical protein